MAQTTRRNPGRPVYVVDGTRTPFLKARGKPGPFKAVDLAVAAGRPLLLRQPFEADRFDEVILGCVAPGPDEANIGRIAALRLGCGERVPAWTVQRNCASGMQALDAAFRNIADGRSDLVLAGGVESMSHSPVLLSDGMVAWLAEWQRARSPLARFRQLTRLRPRDLAPVIGLLRGLRDPVVGISMGQTAENLAHRFGLSREQMDAFAMRSHQRLAAAYEAGHLADEIAIAYARDGTHYERDDGLRADTDMAQLARLRPVFDKPFGTVTAGNSAQVTDGCAWLVLASEKAVKEHDLAVLGRIVDVEWAGLDPAQMGLGPVHATVPLLKRKRLSLDKIDYWEINEAFAAQVLACVEALKDERYCKESLGLGKAAGEIPIEHLNVDGGGISLGHPVGASGARIVLHLLHVLRRENARRGIASLCIGGGQGGAMLVENTATE
ncbi:MAG TPA: acetyl-CoA C-acetyltransferase [Thioalkalivibrio sp.]|nr:acetyl-CoA C-acetyltransferase [Thioalkalivibrio sp.]